MLWYKATVLTDIFLVDCVWVLGLNDVALVNSLTPVPAMKWLGLVSQLESGGTTDRARCRAIGFVVVSKLVVHRLDKAP